jgi:hypothetical protein
MSLHKYVGPNGYRRIDHMREMMARRNRLAEEFGEDSGTSSQQPTPGGSNFSRERHDNPDAVDSLKREVANIIGTTVISAPDEIAVVPYDGTEDPASIEATRPVHPPTSIQRASLPA